MTDILDQSVAKLKEALPGLSSDELRALRKAEVGGKTRKGALQAIDEALAAAEPPEEPEDAETAPASPVEAIPPGFEEVENIVEGQDITLHDGSHLLFGETAPVPAELAATLREREQAR
jgi:hypothetical protein